ncbi:MAG: metal-dependent transcriptional regulator [Sphaerochaetaceae bacterium]|nr:metal-dependent transcriptional regulator [Spirochaetales bacterium]MDY5499808.1 metal-dependent transcriptional regulator [Sphaerochaetaceae bacterium]
MVMQEAGEMYLETILRIQEEQGYVRSIDVANRMGYSKPTISEQMKKFREAGLVSFDDEMHINLTPKGSRIAKKTYERHVAITSFLETIGVSPVTAENDACRFEHYISDETFNCMKAFAKEHKPQ